MERRAGGGRVGRAGLTAGGVLVSLAALVLLAEACAQTPPRASRDACRIFADNPQWRAAAVSAGDRWGVHPATILAVIHQESRFRPTARPGWRRLLGVVPIAPRSSAYGYGQVKDGTWDDYRDRTDRPLARRDRFDDVADFVGWYADVIHRLAGVSKDDPFHLYLAYHEGPNGFLRRSFDAKPWLLRVARKVDDLAREYAGQFEGCGGPPALARRD